MTLARISSPDNNGRSAIPQAIVVQQLLSGGSRFWGGLCGLLKGDPMLQPGSSALIYLLWILAAVPLAAVVVGWPLLARSGALTMLARVLTQLVATGMVVLAVAGTLNQRNGWYVTWTDLSRDLVGSRPSIQRVAVTGRLPQATASNQVAAAAADRQARRMFGVQRSGFQRSAGLRSVPSPQGQYLYVVVPGLGPAAGPTAGKVLIWLPPTYVSGTPRATYPVIQAYAGIPGSPDELRSRLGLQHMIIEQHRATGLVEPIVVMPDYTPGGLDTECTNSPRVAMETWLNSTVRAWVLHHLRARPDRASWAVMGYSAGGFCAQVSAFLHPRVYGAAMLFGSYNRPYWGNWKPYGRAAVWPARYNLLRVAAHRAPAIDIWIEVSGGDRFAGPAARQLIRTVHAPTSLTAIYLSGVGHRFSVWKSVMPTALAWLGHSEAGFKGHSIPVAALRGQASSPGSQRVLPTPW